MPSQETGITAPVEVPGPLLTVEPHDHTVPTAPRPAHEATAPTTGAALTMAGIPQVIALVEVQEVINPQEGLHQDPAIIHDLQEPPEVQEAIEVAEVAHEAPEAIEAVAAVHEAPEVSGVPVVHPEVQVAPEDHPGDHPDLVEEAVDPN